LVELESCRFVHTLSLSPALSPWEREPDGARGASLDGSTSDNIELALRAADDSLSQRERARERENGS
jgi:hypothetical protein